MLTSHIIVKSENQNPRLQNPEFVEGSLMMAGSSSFCGKRIKRTGKEEEQEQEGELFNGKRQ
jgi:hypothetical protein